MQNNLKLKSGTSNASTAKEGLDFILCHVCEPTFLRTISTAATYGAQVLVYSEEEAAEKFAASNLLDCRINAYPAFTCYKGINRQAPNFIFIDLDRCSFATERAHKLALDKTLRNIRLLGAEPTALWSGNGYHIYLPVNAFILEQEEIFAEFNEPSKRFLRFAAKYLSNHKSDPNNNPSLKSCMIRIPGSRNSKSAGDSAVKIVHRWNGHRPDIRLLLGSFHAWLVDQRIKERRSQRGSFKIASSSNGNNIIQWIEKVLQTPITDYRKLAVWRVLAPYLLNVRCLSSVEAHHVILEWLDNCSQLRRLDFNPNYRIRSALNNSKDFFPISREKLKVENEGLYRLLQDNGVLT